MVLSVKEKVIENDQVRDKEMNASEPLMKPRKDNSVSKLHIYFDGQDNLQANLLSVAGIRGVQVA